METWAQSVRFMGIMHQGVKHRGGIFVRTPLPCGCLFDWYFGGRGYYRGGCPQHAPNQPAYICPSNGCGRVLPTLAELKAHKEVHAY